MRGEWVGVEIYDLLGMLEGRTHFRAARARACTCPDDLVQSSSRSTRRENVVRPARRRPRVSSPTCNTTQPLIRTS